MKKICLTALAFVMLFVLMSNTQAQSQTDEEFIAKLNGARYILTVTCAIGTLDIRGNKIIPGMICTNSRCGGPLGEWQRFPEDYYINGRGFRMLATCTGSTGYAKDWTKAIFICKISDDSITCVGGCDGGQTIYTRER